MQTMLKHQAFKATCTKSCPKSGSFTQGRDYTVYPTTSKRLFVQDNKGSNIEVYQRGDTYQLFIGCTVFEELS